MYNQLIRSDIFSIQQYLVFNNVKLSDKNTVGLIFFRKKMNCQCRLVRLEAEAECVWPMVCLLNPSRR